MKTYTLNCSVCKVEIIRTSKQIASSKCQNLKQVFCSKKCQAIFRTKSVTEPCSNCSTVVTRSLSQRKQIKNVFCNRSCAASYNNKHKSHGNKRSKLERYLSQQLSISYPSICVKTNSKEVIGSELDFYFPELKLAVEINGIFHYEPIYGLDKLTQIQKNDKQKFKACHEAGIELCTIASLDGYMKKEVLEKYWKQFQALLIPKLAGRAGFEPAYP